MKKYTETRILDASKLRSICIKNDWYTCGNNGQYAAMFAKLRNENGNLVHMTTDKLYDIANDIYYHSDTDYIVEDIMAVLARHCSYYFEEEV